MTVASIFYGSTIFFYCLPTQRCSAKVQKVEALLVVVVTPSLNPFIYNLRNEKVKNSLKDVVRKNIYVGLMYFLVCLCSLLILPCSLLFTATHWLKQGLEWYIYLTSKPLLFYCIFFLIHFLQNTIIWVFWKIKWTLRGIRVFLPP